MRMTTPDSALELLTYEQAAARYGISIRTLARYIKAGHFTAYTSVRDARRRLLNARELTDFMKEKGAHAA